MLKTEHTVHRVHTVHVVHTVHAVHAVYTVHAVHTVHAIHTVLTVHAHRYDLSTLLTDELCLKTAMTFSPQNSISYWHVYLACTYRFLP